MSRLSVSTYIEFHQHTNRTFDPYMPIVVVGALAGGLALAVMTMRACLFRTLRKELGPSVRDLLESEIAGPRAHQCYGEQGHQHRGRDEDEQARHAAVLQNEGDDEAG
jgi:hypothetical protein